MFLCSLEAPKPHSLYKNSALNLYEIHLFQPTRMYAGKGISTIQFLYIRFFHLGMQHTLNRFAQLQY